MRKRKEYDEFILYVDREFGKFMDRLESFALMENIWVVFTLNHGEMFERGIYGHRGTTLYEPVLRIPLIVFKPGRKVGANIYTKTSAVDVLSALLHVTGQKIPDWAEGIVLLPYAPTDPEPNRKIYAMTAEKKRAL